jgi:hypothetical protein
MSLRAISFLSFFTVVLLSCESEQIFVDKVVSDTIWIQSDPIKIIQTKTDTVWVTKNETDTITATREVVVTDTVFVERVVRVVDTVFNEVIETITVTRVDTVYETRTEIVDTQIRIFHPAYDNYENIYQWNDAIGEWFRRVNMYGLKPHARTLIFRISEEEVNWETGAEIVLATDGFYYIITQYHPDEAGIWRILSNVLLDIPFMEVPIPIGGDGESSGPYDTYWYEDAENFILKPEYDHVMFPAFSYSVYWWAEPGKRDWYWKDMFGMN